MQTSTTAQDHIAAYLASILPPETPPCYRSLSNARYVGTGKKRIAIAEVEMFDGQPATLEVFHWNHGHGNRWTAMTGGNAFYEDGRWQRESLAG